MRSKIMDNNNRLLIAIDFDGTCVTHEYPKVGKEIGAVPVLRKIIEAGHTLVLNTMRGNIKGDLGEAIYWFTKHSLSMYCINKSPSQEEWTDSPKVYAHIYIDDAALGCPLCYNLDYSSRPFVDWSEVNKILVKQGIIKQ
jgi:hypothetical protein